MVFLEMARHKVNMRFSTEKDLKETLKSSQAVFHFSHSRSTLRSPRANASTKEATSRLPEDHCQCSLYKGICEQVLMRTRSERASTGCFYLLCEMRCGLVGKGIALNSKASGELEFTDRWSHNQPECSNFIRGRRRSSSFLLVFSWGDQNKVASMAFYACCFFPNPLKVLSQTGTDTKLPGCQNNIPYMIILESVSRTQCWLQVPSAVCASQKPP